MAATASSHPQAVTRRVALACQGGGSHTAFTAGVLGRLVGAEELDDVEIVGLSGTSGGAVCALLAWTALADKRAADTGSLLERFWQDNAATSRPDQLLNRGTVWAGKLQSLGLLPTVSPYQLPFSTFALDRFRHVLEQHVDFSRIDVDRSGSLPVLLFGAVDVETGRFRAFNSRRDRITADCVLASAAIPTLFRAVELDGGHYWDGLFSQNPPVRELLDARPDELWVIQVNPRERSTEPTTVLDIADRRNELSGNLSLYQELAFIEKIDQLLEDGILSRDSKYKQVVVRIIELSRDRLPRNLGPASKLNRDPAFLRDLIAHGREQAERFLTALAFERAWTRRDTEAVMQSFAPDAQLESASPFPDAPAERDPIRIERFVNEHLRDEIQIDPTRKQIAQYRSTWNVRMRLEHATVDGVAEAEIGDAGVTKLRIGV